jgi:hypothetical protein
LTPNQNVSSIIEPELLNFHRFITRDVLRQAMSQYGMGDEATIDEVIEDVDTDKVKILSFDLFITIC